MNGLTKEGVEQAMRYAVAKGDDGSVILTVFEYPSSASVVLPPKWVQMLIRHLTGEITTN